MWHISRTGEVQTGFWWGNLRECDHLEDLFIGGRIILKPIFGEVRWGHMDWIDLVQVRDRLWALVNVMLNLQVP
jgi:hypothetical protein